MIALRKLSRIGKSNRPSAALAIAVFAVAAASASAGSFTPGDLVVSSYGNSGGFADQSPTPISLVEYSPTGGSAVLTDTVTGVVGEYGSSSEGNIQLSGNGQYLTIAGYNATAAANGIDASTNQANGTSEPIGTPFSKSTVDLAQSTDTNVPRVAAFIDANGNVNSSTVLSDVYSTNNPRSVYSPNGSTFYISGQGDGSSKDQGVFFGPTGLNTVTSSGTPTGIYNSEQTRFVTAFNGNLYQSIDTSSGTSTGIWEFNGTPAASATPTRIIPGNNGGSVFYSPEGFFFANATTLYVADTGDPKAGSLGDGGIQKWTLNGSTWTLQYTLAPTAATIPDWVAPSKTSTTSNGESGFAAITGQVVGTGANAKVDLYAISYTLGDDDPDGLYSVVDTLSATSGSGESVSRLELAPGDGGEDFKGVSFAPEVPEPASCAMLLAGGLTLLGRRKSRKSR